MRIMLVLAWWIQRSWKNSPISRLFVRINDKSRDNSPISRLFVGINDKSKDNSPIFRLFEPIYDKSWDNPISRLSMQKAAIVLPIAVSIPTILYCVWRNFFSSVRNPTRFPYNWICGQQCKNNFLLHVPAINSWQSWLIWERAVPEISMPPSTFFYTHK